MEPTFLKTFKYPLRINVSASAPDKNELLNMRAFDTNDDMYFSVMVVNCTSLSVIWDATKNRLKWLLVFFLIHSLIFLHVQQHKPKVNGSNRLIKMTIISDGNTNDNITMRYPVSIFQGPFKLLNIQFLSIIDKKIEYFCHCGGHL
jgi:hypothetical protein